MKKIFDFGKIDYCSMRKTNPVKVEMEYKTNDKGLPVLTVRGEIWSGKKCVVFGQCLDTLNEYLEGNEPFDTIYGLWKRNHLNDMDASANDVQRKAVEEYLDYHPYDYTEVSEYLKKKGVFEVIVNGKSCKYGHEWYYREISEKDRETIDNLMKM